MRALALLLILANLCFWFWGHYVDVPESLPAVSANAPSKPLPPLVLATERPDAAQRAAAITNQLSCLSVGPFSDDSQLQAVAKRLDQAGFTSSPRNAEGDVFAGYWVSIAGFATRADAEQALARLRAAGISDVYMLNDDATANVLSLGLYSDQTHAEQRRADIAKLGFTPQLQNRMRHGQVHWLDVALQEPGQQIDPLLLQPDTGGISRLEAHACPQATSHVAEADKK